MILTPCWGDALGPPSHEAIWYAPICNNYLVVKLAVDSKEVKLLKKQNKTNKTKFGMLDLVGYKI